MKKLRFNTRILLVLFVLFFTISCEKDQLETVRHNDHAAGVKSDQITCEFVTNLIAGQHYDVGDVKVINDGINIYVTYEILEPGWGIKQTHLHIADEFQAIPMTKKGNPKIGQFAYQQEHGMIQKYTYVVPQTWAPGTQLYIAAHAVVDYDYMLAVTGTLPDDADLYPKYPYHQSYFQSLVTNGDLINGAYEGWCIDAGHGIYPNRTYDVTVYSSYENLANLGNVDHPEELDKVNWVLNQDFVGKSSSAWGAYTKEDVQRVIWELVDDFPPQYVGYLPRVNEILELAHQYGEGYVPQCDEYMAVILEPLPQYQVTIIEVPVALLTGGCDNGYGEETAWAEGLSFPGNSWAMFFNFTVCD